MLKLLARGGSGTTEARVISRMLADTLLASFLMQVGFYVVEKFTMRVGRRPAPEIGSPTPELAAGG
jgi:hypothetical protein